MLTSELKKINSKISELRDHLEFTDPEDLNKSQLNYYIKDISYSLQDLMLKFAIPPTSIK